MSTVLSAYISQQQAYQYAASAGFNTSIVPGTNYTQLQTIVGIAGAESGFNSQAINRSDPYGGSYGVLQINGVHFGSGKGMSANGALDPKTAFKYAYTISGGGVNFNPWTVYTNGNYKKFIPADPKTTQPQKLPVNGWWNYPRVDNYGSPDPFGGFPKPDSNILVPDNYPVLNLLPGVVTGINSPSGQVPAWGTAITIKLDSPINSLATHEAYIHLAGLAPNIKVGTHLNMGDLIGYNGGNNATGSQKVPLGFALTPVDVYGYGAQWQQTVGNAKLNPVPLLDSAKSGNLSSGTLSTVSTITTGATSFNPQAILDNMPKIQVSANADVIALLIVFDELLTIYNPFPPLPSINVNILGVQASFPDIGSWFVGLSANIAQDIAAILIRAIIFFLGVYIIFRVVDRLTGIMEKIGKTVETGATIAALAA